MNILPVTVIIPTYNGAENLIRLLPCLAGQSPSPQRIVVIDSSSRDQSATMARDGGCLVEVIPQREFNHGGTRNRAVDFVDSRTEVIVFLTQDALPERSDFLANLALPILEGQAQATYGRQIAYPDASPGEVFARSFNYPTQSQMRTEEDVARLGLKAFFFSNVASAVSLDWFRRVGGFPGDVIMNEDMVLCARILSAGGKVAYCADAVVRHSHNYTLRQQFRRYFDIGAFLATSDLVRGKSLGEGLKFAKEQVRWCWQNQARWSVPRSVLESAVKFIAVQLGKRERWLPISVKRRLSMHAFHW